MFRSRYVSSGTQDTQPDRDAPPGPDAGARRSVMPRLITGVALSIIVLLLGEVAKTGLVARLDLRAD